MTNSGIGVRELKIAAPRSFSQEGVGDLRQTQREEALQKLDTLAEEIARSWRSPKTALELLEDQRR
jgi:hypothetical protein